MADVTKSDITSKVKLTGLWFNDDKTVLSGNFTYSSRLVAFKNKYKKTEKDPDFILYTQEKKKPENKKDTPDNQEKD